MKKFWVPFFLFPLVGLCQEVETTCVLNVDTDGVSVNTESCTRTPTGVKWSIDGSDFSGFQAPPLEYKPDADPGSYSIVARVFLDDSPAYGVARATWKVKEAFYPSAPKDCRDIRGGGIDLVNNYTCPTAPAEAPPGQRILSWRPVTTAGGEPTTVNGYAVYSNMEDRIYQSVTVVDPTACHTFVDTPVGKSGVYAVTAFNDAGESACSEIIFTACESCQKQTVWRVKPNIRGDRPVYAYADGIDYAEASARIKVKGVRAQQDTLCKPDDIDSRDRASEFKIVELSGLKYVTFCKRYEE